MNDDNVGRSKNPNILKTYYMDAPLMMLTCGRVAVVEGGGEGDGGEQAAPDAARGARAERGGRCYWWSDKRLRE